MGSKQKILLLHGALGSAEQLMPLANRLQDNFMPLSFTFSGHGTKEGLHHPFRIERFAQELEQWLSNQQLTHIPVFGYSMGGYVALYLASRSQHYFSQILTLGTKFNWTPEGAAQEAIRLQPEVIAEKVPAFAAMLAQRHGAPQWQTVITRTAEMMLSLGQQPLLKEEELALVQQPVSIMRGGDDTMVSEAESRWAADSLPNGSFALLAHQPHPLEQVKIEKLAIEIEKRLLNN